MSNGLPEPKITRGVTYCRQRTRKKVSHMDDWLMTYADMITLLLCFFVLLASSLIVEKRNTPKAHSVQKEETTQTPDPREPEKDVSAEPALEPPTPCSSLPEIVDNLKSQTPASIEQNGDRITSLEISSTAFFDRGSAVLSPTGKIILREVAENLKGENYRDYQVMVEGHTDDIPISTSLFPSNWELSTARASAVVRFFLDAGIPAHRLRAAGYADTFPKLPNRDANGTPIPANQAQNRRVVIKLEKIEKTT